MSFLNEFSKKYDKIMNILASRYLDDMMHNIDKIEKVYNLLSDDNSKKTFLNDILMLILSNFLKGDQPSYYSGLMLNHEWNTHMRKVEHSNLYPDIAHPDLPNAKYITNYCKTATFLLEQYRYEDKVKIENGDICIDAGACLGDTSLYFFMNGAKRSYAFEIDKLNIEAISNTFSNKNHELIIVNKALSNIDDKIYYSPMPNNIGGDMYLSKSLKNQQNNITRWNV